MGGRQDIEHAIVGAVVNNGAAALDALAGRQFKIGEIASSCRTHFASALRLRARNLTIDPVTIKAELESRDEFEAAGGAAYLGRLIDQGSVNGSLLAYVDLLRELPEAGTDELPDLSEERNRTDIGASKAFVVLHGRDLRHVHGEGWRPWSGKAWSPDRTGEVMARAKATAAAMLRSAVEINDRENQKAAVKWALKLHSEARLTAMINLAAAEPGIGVTREAFDRDPWTLNVENGAIDLKTGALRAHRRSDMICNMAGVHYDETAVCPRWLSFLECIFDGNANLTSYVQRLFGYSLTADIREQVLVFFHGGGANGKSTAIRIAMDLLGDYARTAPMRALLVGRNDEHPTAIAGLRGARLVAGTEADEGRRLAEAVVKQLSGGDRVTARRMREDYFEFVPTFKIILAVNHRPEIRGTDAAIWRRIHLVPFNVTIPDDEQDRDLLNKLRDELPGILNWALAGCLEWQRGGLRPPSEVLEATKAYRADSDVLAQFIEEACVLARVTSVGKGELFKAYTTWTDKRGERPIGKRSFGDRIREHGIAEDRDRQRGHFWKGIGLLTTEGA